MFIDSHAHIYAEQFEQDLDQVIARSQEAGIAEIFMPNIDHTSIDRMMEVEEKYPNCVSMMGLHPCSVNKNFQKELYVVEEWLQKRTFAAIGEIGTDLYWDTQFKEQQIEAFMIQANWAIDKELPIVIHCRESIDLTIELVEKLQPSKLSGVFHCFTGSVEQAERIIKLGFKLGIGGVATFKNGNLTPVLQAIDLNHFLLETDSPYLAPVPYRGKRNEPSYIPLIAQKVAECKKISLTQVAEQTTINSQLLFNKKKAYF